MELGNKEHTKLKLATCFRIILKQKKSIGIKNKANNIEDIRLVDSMRQLEAESGLSYTIIQNTSAGKRDIQFTTLLTMIENLGLSFTEFAKLYDKITEKQIFDEKTEIDKSKKPKTKKRVKKSLPNP
ncbi:hypothetical protein QWZ08_00370 [Ferruginibacter paludis]|uniref:hypothetical protein n=1 Tax=Ferruginibacter paludis TaxID=1310417 RepID=UPI0025B57D80|nr:hypothetical protein [Ferruginibacter paludis]MDN3654055.1 hypothetical protein [Ferruginibacter paludis]